MSVINALAAGSLLSTGIYGFVAPVQRGGAGPASFDPAKMGRFDLGSLPAGWVSLGPVPELRRSSGEDVAAIWSGAPATVTSQVRSRVQEELTLTFAGWTRIAMALSSGQQTMNLLRTATGAAAAVSGGPAAVAENVGAGSTAGVLQLAATTAVQAGDVVVVDADYSGAMGFVGAGAPGAFVSSSAMSADVDYVRRVSFNVARVLSVSGGVVTLATQLPAGVPVVGMKACVVEGFVDRNGGSFLQEWSALFVLDGFQGDRLLLHYPRLQPAGGGAAEAGAVLAPGVTRWRPTASLRALPVTDATDGVQAVCFRTYLPAPMRMV